MKVRYAPARWKSSRKRFELRWIFWRAEAVIYLARPATIPRARAAETERKAISYHFLAECICEFVGKGAAERAAIVGVTGGVCDFLHLHFGSKPQGGF